MLASATKTACSETGLERRNRLVMEHLPLVKSIAIRVRDSLPANVELDDLIHAGLLGLTDAATRFEAERNIGFPVFARHRIRGAILDSLREMDWVSRDLRRRQKQAERVTRELSASLHRQPSEEEVAQRLGLDLSRWRQIAVDLQNLGIVSASSRGQDNDQLPAPDFPGHPSLRPDVIRARGELREKLDAAMGKLPERYRKVVVLYFTNEMTMKEIGAVLGVNESRVSQIQKSALAKLAEALQAAGIKSSRAFH